MKRIESNLSAVVLLGILLLGLSAGYLYASNIPLPPNTAQVKEEKRRMFGNELNIRYYESSEEPSGLKDFFRRRLSVEGWQAKETLLASGSMKSLAGIDVDQFKQIQGLVNMDAIKERLKQQMSSSLIFEKEGKTMVINFIDGKLVNKKKTIFSVSEGNIFPTSLSSLEANMFPELIAEPKNKVAPVYTGATLTMLDEKPNSMQAMYMTTDNINAVVGFYKENMPGHEWSLIEEDPVRKGNFAGISKEVVAQRCPTCADNTNLSDKRENMLYAMLKFSNSGMDIYRIVFSSLDMSEEGAAIKPVCFTTIMVNYEKSK